MTKNEILNKLKVLGDFYQNIQLADDIWTKREGRFPTRGKNCKTILETIPADLTGKSVLDIGCNAGYFSLVCKDRGADYVMGIDRSEKFIRQAKFCADVKNVDIDYRIASINDIPKIGKVFDLVLFIGVLYHLSDVESAFEKISACCKNMIIIETATDFKNLTSKKPIIRNTRSISKIYGNSRPNLAAIEELIRMGGFKSFNSIFVGGRTCYVAWKENRNE